MVLNKGWLLRLGGRKQCTFVYMKKSLFFLALSAFTSLQLAAQERIESANTVEESPEIKRMMAEFVEHNKAHRTIKGFRVQIYNGGKTESQKHKSAFMKAFPDIRAYMVYEYPEYRIQVGDYRDELAAERALLAIRDQFPGAFTVSGNVNWPDL